MESTESRYAHLLQPIRELTKNWDVDVAAELNDYLEELDEMCITFDGGKTQLNFAEAALLIQGSACIYSKKVELLHHLVYQTLGCMKENNKKRNKAACPSEEDHDDEERSKEEEQFSSLEVEESKVHGRSDGNTLVGVAPLPPISLLPPESHEKQKLPFISVKGELVCSVRDFRINIFIPRDDILILSHQSAADFHLHLPLPQPDPATDALATCDQGGGDEGGVEDFAPLEENPMEEENPMVEEEHLERQQRGGSGDGRMVRERRHVEEERWRKEAETPPTNVWALEDPYSKTKEEKPFKQGKCYSVPAGLDDGGKRKRKGSSGLEDFRTWFTGRFNPSEPKLKRGPKHADLNYIFLNSLKQRVRRQRTVSKRNGQVISDQQLRASFLQWEEAGQQLQEAEPGDDPPNEQGGVDDDVLEDEELIEFPQELQPPGTQGEELSYEELVKLRVEQLVVNSRGYTQESELSRRVKLWKNLIVPQLEQQESSPVFDIHDYGRRIVEFLSSVGCCRSFGSLVRGKNNYEAAKYLLAALQLANDYTVEVGGVEGLEEGLDSMSLTLLSTLRATDRFQALPVQPLATSCTQRQEFPVQNSASC